MDTTFPHNSFFGLGRIITSAHYGPCMPHSSSRGSCFTGNKANDWLLATTCLVPLCGIGFHLSTYFTYHDHTCSFRIIDQQFNRFLCGSADYRITTYSNGSCNSKALAYYLVCGLIGQGP